MSGLEAAPATDEREPVSFGPVLVGYRPEDRGRGGLHLGRALAASAGTSLVVACVIPDRWSSVGAGRSVDRDYENYLVGLAKEALAHAREALRDRPVEVDYRVVTARSGPAGLMQTAAQTRAAMLVVGSSADGPWGHIALGSTSDRLLHSSTVPVALAPRGLRLSPDVRVRRVTVAVDGSAASQEVLTRAAAVAQRVSASLRVVSFAVRAGTMYPPETGLHVEDRVVAAWRQQAEALIAGQVATLAPGLHCEPELQVSEGRTWAQALEGPEWLDGEVLVIGSSATEPRLSRVFLGSTATRIIRHSPVPVVVVP